MAMAGRKPKPTALKVLEGDRGKGRRPLNEHEPIPPKGGIKCPSWLLPEAKKEWKRLAASLEAMGVLTMADLTAFAGYCQAYARWREAEDFITQHGSIFFSSRVSASSFWWKMVSLPSLNSSTACSNWKRKALWK